MQPEQNNLYYANTSAISTEAHKVLRNTYTLLAMTLLFSSVAAGIGLAMNLGRGVGIVCSLAALAIVWLVIPRVANKASGIYWVFGFTGLLGLGLAPTLNYYLSAFNGGTIITQALAGTAVTFLGLSAYVTTTKKDFSFLGGFLAVGSMVMIFSVLAFLVLSLFGIQMPVLHLALSAGIIILMSGFILFETSSIIQGHETNYVNATVSLYLSIYNLFVSLLHIIGAFSGDD